MESVSLDLLRNYILSKGGSVTSQEIVREFQPFLKDPANKERNKGLFKSYLSTLTEYRQDEGSSVKILELKKAYRTDAYLATTPTKENHPTNKVLKDQLQPMRERQKFQRDTQRDILRNRATTEAARSGRAHPASSEAKSRPIPVDNAKSRHVPPAPTKVIETPLKEEEKSAVTAEEQDIVPIAVVTPTRVEVPVIRKASINAINMFNRTAAQQKQRPIASLLQPVRQQTVDKKADTLDSQSADLREEMESGCSNVTLEQHEKEWIIKASQGDLESLTRLLLTDHKLVEFRDFITGYTGLHWACKLSRLDMAKVLLDGGSKVNTASHSGQTALHLAAQSGNCDMIELLLRYDADKEQRDYRGRKPCQYLSPNADCQAKTLLSLPQSVSVTQQGSRKASKAMTLGSDGFAENTPKRTHTINQAWKKLKGPSFKTSFASKKSKKDTHKSERLASPRTETKENRQLGAQTLPSQVARTMPATYF